MYVLVGISLQASQYHHLYPAYVFSIFIFLLAYTSPIHPPKWLPAPGFHPSPAVMGDRPDGSCPQNPPLDTTKRTKFDRQGCTAYCYPSSGGVLTKILDIVDMQFLQLDRFMPAQRSANVAHEDEFCARMRKVGATWWADEQEWIEVQLGVREKTELEDRVLVFGWPSSGEGAWVLRYESESEVLRDFGRVHMAVDMDERCRIMKDLGATFYADVEKVKELTVEL